MKKFNVIVLSLIVMLVLAACGGAQAEPAPVVESEVMADTAVTTTEENMDETAHTDEMAEEHTDEMAEDEMAATDDMAEEEMAEADDSMADSDDSMADPSEEMMAVPDWQHIELTDARTGETFTLADFSGKTVFVEPMATWCTNCRRQLGNVRDARAQLGEEAVFIGLSLETTISDAELAQYQSDQGFDWIFAVMPPELLQQLADAFGQSITSAPSTPHFIIRPDGSITELVTGIESAEQIAEQIEAAQG